MTYAQRFSGVALVVGVVMVWGSGAGAEPPDGYAPNPPSPPAPPTLTMSTPEVVEGTGGPNEMVFTFELDKPASGGESFRFYTEDAQGSALPVEDHEPMLEFPDFGPGDTELTVAIPIVTDDVPEADEHILVQMDHPMGLTIIDGSGTGVILDDDVPTLTIDDVTLVEGTGLGTIVDDDERKKAATPTTTAPTRTTTPTTTTVIRTAAIDATLAASEEQAPVLDLRPAAAVGLTVLGALSLVAAWRVRQG